MRLKKIVFATDFSTNCEPARELATSLARDGGAMMFIVHVVDRPFEDLAACGDQSAEATDAGRQLSRTQPTDPDVGYAQRLLTGPPPDAIARFADEHDADLIVIGSHGRTGGMRVLLGSVAETLMRRAKCSVLTVKPASPVVLA
ncbi:MAG: universal stress protein [Pirellulaceae bacterium]|jgi:nucleotide-binding universal stress UspA family protein|nr:universal stress protein [Pirellulaceae bacterium]MDP7017297.1 universal stress protein [Pirellulaceae bacterium]